MAIAMCSPKGQLKILQWNLIIWISFNLKFRLNRSPLLVPTNRHFPQLFRHRILQILPNSNMYTCPKGCTALRISSYMNERFNQWLQLLVSSGTVHGHPCLRSHWNADATQCTCLTVSIHLSTAKWFIDATWSTTWHWQWCGARAVKLTHSLTHCCA